MKYRIIKLINAAFILISTYGSAFAINKQVIIPQKIEISNFIVKGNESQNNKLSIIATDKQGKLMKNIDGTFQFNMNGFNKELNFNDGITIFQQEINESTFIYLRHKNEAGTQGKLYYIFSKNGNLNPIEISWLILVIIPVSILIIIFLFRKLIIIVGIILILLFFFNSTNGLNLSMFIETIFDGLRNLVRF
ncbi:MAG: hypothetical protein WC380_08515 [Pedobacter sp.]|jgi:hypothetical protein